MNWLANLAPLSGRQSLPVERRSQEHTAGEQPQGWVLDHVTLREARDVEGTKGRPPLRALK